MPFDPIRDAILNSPTVQQRRATDISVLLNDDSMPPRSSSLSHILIDPEQQYTVPNEKLDYFQPISRSKSSYLSINPGEGDDEHRPTSSRSHSPPRYTVSPITEPSPRPSSSLSASPRHTPIVPHLPPPSKMPLAYAPKTRISSAASVLVPMSPVEMSMYKTYVGQGSARLTKRKRAGSEELPDLPPQKRHAGDVGLVVDHYNSRPEVDVVQRQDSPIIGLKNFNNWIKSVIISHFAHPVLQAARPSSGRGRGKVLDMGCGKGGDLTKWSKARINEMVGADIAAVSVNQARQRWESMRNRSFDAHFAATDCYSEPLTNAFPPEIFSTMFDVVSMQFCMHYAFESEEKARQMLDNVSRWLRPGGVFIGTIPNAEMLLSHLNELPSDEDEFGNSVYTIHFENRHKRSMFGDRYTFFLKDAVDDVPEYIVQWDNFLQLAAEYNLHQKYKEEFHQVFNRFEDHSEFRPLMIRMKVVDRNGESAMDEDQWEAANIYLAFVFEKS